MKKIPFLIIMLSFSFAVMGQNEDKITLDDINRSAQGVKSLIGSFKGKKKSQSIETGNNNQQNSSILETTPPNLPEMCSYDKLSSTFKFTISVVKSKVDEEEKIMKVNLGIIKKSDNSNYQEIAFKPNEDWISYDCSSRSYTTGHNLDSEMGDGEWDVIVADFNFDGKEDIAVKSGSKYKQASFNYYLQSASGLYRLDKYLTENLVGFPDEINAARKTLSRAYAVGSRQVHTDVFEYNMTTNNWTIIKSLDEDISTGPNDAFNPNPFSPSETDNFRYFKVNKSDTAFILTEKNPNKKTNLFFVNYDEVVIQKIDGDYGLVQYVDSNSNKKYGWVKMDKLH